MTSIHVQCDRCGRAIDRDRLALAVQCGRLADRLAIDPASGRPTLDLCPTCAADLFAWLGTRWQTMAGPEAIPPPGD